MREIGKILSYLIVVVLGAAVLAPPLFWLGQWAIAADIIPQLRPFGFEKYFNRAVLVLALGLLWPWLNWLGLRRWTDMRLAPNPRRWQHLVCGVALSTGGLAGVAALLVRSELLAWHGIPAWPNVAAALLSGVVVGCIEETFFRGALLGLLRRRLPWGAALLFLTAFFASLHFVRPDPALGRITAASWSAGFSLLPHLVWQFGHLDRVLGTLVTLLLMGFVLGYSVVRTRSLYLAIGLHAGWIFAFKLVGASTGGRGRSVWVQDDLRSGLAPILLMVATSVVMAGILRQRPAPGGLSE